MQEKYGNINTLYVGGSPVVVLHGFQMIKDALVRSGVEFAGRPFIPVLYWITQSLGIVTAPYGPSWRQQRKFALMTLRRFGLGKKPMEERISEEAVCLIRAFQEDVGRAVDPYWKVTNAVSNIICLFIFGNRFDYKNDEFQHLLFLISRNLQLAGGPVGQIYNIFPFIKHLPGPHQEIRRNAQQVGYFVGDAVHKHRDSLNRGLQDFIDAYLLEIEKQKHNPESTFTIENLQMTIADLFLAGTDTASSVLRWGLLYMMACPTIQERCQQEIDEVLGSERLPSWEDRLKMPYVNATVHEILRFGNISPNGIPREVTKDTSFRGYFLAKGTMVLPNLASILFDQSLWKDPHHFNPENFLDEKGQFLKHEAMIPFCTGLRVCLGEHLARMEIFIFFTTLLQHLDFTWPDPAHPPDFLDVVGFVRSPQSYKLICRVRPGSFLQNKEHEKFFPETSGEYQSLC